MIPGEVRVSTEPLEFGTDAEKITMVVVNDAIAPFRSVHISTFPRPTRR